MTEQSIADLCRPISARVQPAARRDTEAVGIADLVPPPRIRPVVINPAQPVPVDVTPPKPVAANPARSRHDPAVQAAREAVRAAYDGKRSTARIAELTGIPRRTVFDHLRAMGLAPIKGKAGPAADHPKVVEAAKRREQVKAMATDGKSGREIADALGVAISTIHADMKALRIRIPKGRGRGAEALVKARQAAAAKKREETREKRIAEAMARFEDATRKAMAALAGQRLENDARAMLLGAVTAITA